mmetsp:Transcript_9636/g.13608  ORF Transcript_9636/g.13608 Transcript_9636/m.13608 type:complete len:112 (-) Transcript_9636:234-569(-)
MFFRFAPTTMKASISKARSLSLVLTTAFGVFMTLVRTSIQAVTVAAHTETWVRLKVPAITMHTLVHAIVHRHCTFSGISSGMVTSCTSIMETFGPTQIKIAGAKLSVDVFT